LEVKLSAEQQLTLLEPTTQTIQNHTLLFYRGQQMQPARYPNVPLDAFQQRPATNWSIIPSAAVTGPPGTTQMCLPWTVGDDRPKRWAAAAARGDLLLHGMFFVLWKDSFADNVTVDVPNRLLCREGGFPEYGAAKGGVWYATNLIEELDAPGEFVLDRKRGVVLLWPPTLAPTPTPVHEQTAPVGTALYRSTPATSTSTTSISTTTTTTTTTTTEPTLLPGTFDPGAVRITNASTVLSVNPGTANVSFSGFAFRYARGACVAATGPARLMFDQCEVSDAGAEGISIGATPGSDIRHSEPAGHGARIFIKRYPHSRRVPLKFTLLLRLKRCHAYNQWHSAAVATPLTGWYCKLCPNTEGQATGSSRAV
jgi:hypothetical protein